MIRYDERCSSCYLGHGHDEREHWLQIAQMETWGRKSGPWVPHTDEAVTAGMDIWLQDHAPLRFTREEILRHQHRPIR
jgi:hypothetical protein